MQLAVVILAAGQGKRMFSDLPKVLHLIGAKPLLAHVLDTVNALNVTKRLVVYGHGGETVKDAFADEPDIDWVLQEQQLGTGHAVAQTLPLLDDDDIVVVLYADVPLLQSQRLTELIESAESDKLGLLTVKLDDPSGYGRIIRDDNGYVRKIVEEKDATLDERRVCEINTGILAVRASKLRTWVNALSNDNAQGEYYLTDIIEMAVKEGVIVESFSVSDPLEVQGINNRLQLAELERSYQRRQAKALMLKGVTLKDPERIDVRGHLNVGKDVVIDVNTVFEGEVTLGDRVYIGPNTVLRDTCIDNDSQVLAFSHLDTINAGQGVHVGPYARLRPGTQLANGVRIGNFVEVKNAVIGPGAKASHLTYIGDAEVGSDVNVGAGTITCNYDGVNKHKTIIEDEAFIGSNTALIAPVRIGKGAFVGAGSVISRNVAPGQLAFVRGVLKLVDGWRRPTKKKT